ncbi:MAG TPA: hypothetical protein VM389_13350 [Phycisphaerae bacterium]|nr:hypothetical protein [Phycisphaerae bacterium]
MATRSTFTRHFGRGTALVVTALAAVLCQPRNLAAGTGVQAVPPPARPYKYASLKGLSNDKVAAYMGRGRTQDDFERSQVIDTQTPVEFWTTPARQAAMAVVEANRTVDQRRARPLSVDDSDGQTPPEVCSVYYSYRSRRCYFTRDSKYFLRVDPKGSYLACSTGSGMGVVFADILEAGPRYELRYLDLPYRDARHIAHVIWWLGRLRPWEKRDGFFAYGWSSADGSGALRMDCGGKQAVSADGAIWADAVSQRWSGEFGPVPLLNVVDHLMRITLPKRLGEPWAAQQSDGKLSLASLLRAVGPEMAAGFEEVDVEEVEEAARRKLARQAARYVELFSPDQSRLSHSMLTDAVRAAGDLALTTAEPSLLGMQKRLPPPAKPVRTREQVERLWREGARENRGVFDDGGKDVRESLRLHDELVALEHGVVPDTAREELRQAVALALRKIDLADDAAKLEEWARSGQEGWQWTLHRLRGVDTGRYAAALEWWLRHTEGKWSRQVFAALVQADPKRAKELAAQVPADMKSDLTVMAYTILDKAGAIEDRDERIDALIKVALDPGSGWHQRGQAIDLLVPPEAPLKYPDRRIDDAMVRLFDPALGDDPINFTVRRACLALARRGRLEHFDAMAKLAATTKDGQVHNDVLACLVRLARLGKPRHREQVLAMLQPHLTQTNRMLSEIILLIYAMDLRELRAALETLATAGPEDYEERKAYSSSSGEPTPVKGRYHMARKVATLWNEEDPLTRAKLLIVFGFSAERELDGVAVETVRQQLGGLGKTLPPDQAGQVVAFLDWYEHSILRIGPATAPTDRPELSRFVREAFTVSARKP